jgi:hypothetical protein
MSSTVALPVSPQVPDVAAELHATPWTAPELSELLSGLVDDERLGQFLTQLRDCAMQVLVKAGFAHAYEYPAYSLVLPAHISVARSAAVYDSALDVELKLVARLQVRLEQGLEGVARAFLMVFGKGGPGGRPLFAEKTVTFCAAPPNLTRAPDPLAALLTHFRASGLTDLQSWSEEAQDSFAQALCNALKS